MSVKEELEFLSVTCNDVEFRCEQWKEDTYDMHNESYKETRRSVWLSKAGDVLDDDIAMKLFRKEGKNKERQDLHNRLWKEED